MNAEQQPLLGEAVTCSVLCRVRLALPFICLGFSELQTGMAQSHPPELPSHGSWHWLGLILALHGNCQVLEGSVQLLLLPHALPAVVAAPLVPLGAF